MLAVDITDMGGLPYTIARPILIKVDNATQLRRIEINSPNLEEDTAECWKRLIARDFPTLSERHRFVPSNPRSWHKIYAKYKKTDADARRAAEEKLTNAFKSIKQEKADTSSQVVTYDSRRLPRLPRDVKPQVGTRPKGYRGGHDQSELRFSGGSRTKTNTPKSLLKRAVREAKEISARNRLNTPAGALRVRPGQIMRAPQGMVQEKINKARPLTGIRPPGHSSQRQAGSSALEDRESRLRRAKEANSHRGGAYISDEDLDDLEIEDEDEHEHGRGGLDVDDLEALFDKGEPSSKADPSGSGSSSAKGNTFPRRMGSSAAGPSTSRVVHVEAQTKPKSAPLQKEPSKSSISPALGPTSPPKPAPSSCSASPSLGPMPRKRKPAGVFMKPKPKTQRL
jgi:elongin-A